MTERTEIRNTILKSKKINYETGENDNRYVKAKEEIRVGEIILIEHCYSSKKIEMISNVIYNNPELFNNLYPREKEWDEELIQKGIEELSKLSYKKTRKNAFCKNGVYMIGLDISRFNHSIEPNVTVKYLECETEEEEKCNIIYVYAHENINKEEEITISYGNGYFGDKKIKEVLFKLERNYINKIVEQYLKKDKCKEIVFNHICILNGIYFINDMICPTERFIEYYKKEEKKECNKENVIEWIKERKDKFNRDYLSFI